MERRFEYEKPIENEDLIHKIILESEGKHIGEAQLEYRNNPFPFYYMHFIYVDNKYEGRGFGRELFEQVNKYLDDRGKPGILVNDMDRKSPAREMYTRHGWSYIDGHDDYMGYNLGDIPKAQIEKAVWALGERNLRMEKEKEEAA